jgi:uncharacterized repeat protein (TIGR03803 family)
MNSTSRSLIFHATLAVTAVAFSLGVCARAQTFTTLASFTIEKGYNPASGSLVQATDGNYYGTNNAGPLSMLGPGTVFKVTPSLLTPEEDIYDFCSKPNCTDGANPTFAPVLGTDGNLYGATTIGGNPACLYGCGTIFKMTIGGELTTLYSFCAVTCDEGTGPIGLVQASNGKFYGTAGVGGEYFGGAIFEISPAGKFKLLYKFPVEYGPSSPLMQASNGKLYGITQFGGKYDAGTVYEITTAGLFKTLYSFCSRANCADGKGPLGILTQDSSGNLRGATFYGGVYGYGTVFEITTTHQLITLHSFDSTDGAGPVSGPIQASDGNFYGTTDEGGAGNGTGTIYEITSAGVFSSLYSFCTGPICGVGPTYALAQATNGEFIGATTAGGAGMVGTVYSYATGLGAFVQTVPKAAKVGARVLILGYGLNGSTGVTFNGTTATFTVVSDTEITATVPQGATTGIVAVTTPFGKLNSNPPFQVMK